MACPLSDTRRRCRTGTPHRRVCDPSSPLLRSAQRARARASGSDSDRTPQYADLLEPGVSGNLRRSCARRLALGHHSKPPTEFGAPGAAVRQFLGIVEAGRQLPPGRQPATAQRAQHHPRRPRHRPAGLTRPPRPLPPGRIRCQLTSARTVPATNSAPSGHGCPTQAEPHATTPLPTTLQRSPALCPRRSASWPAPSSRRHNGPGVTSQQPSQPRRAAKRTVT